MGHFQPILPQSEKKDPLHVFLHTDDPVSEVPEGLEDEGSELVKENSLHQWVSRIRHTKYIPVYCTA